MKLTLAKALGYDTKK